MIRQFTLTVPKHEYGNLRRVKAEYDRARPGAYPHLDDFLLAALNIGLVSLEKEGLQLLAPSIVLPK